MDYQQTVAYLFSRLPMYSRIGADAFRKDLTNTIRLCNELGNPQQHFKTIHVAGTNGKGSVSHMLASVLQAAGYKTGLYTSPHLKDFRERIRVNGELCREDFVVSFTERIRPLIETIDPSFFEITVAMAFDYFAVEKVDVAVIEVGLGGRLDSTNIITPELSVITNISWDHMNMLGDTLEKIATEKAGIIKQNIPVVVGETIPETKHVFENISLQKNASITIATDQRYIAGWRYEHHMLSVEVADHLHVDHEKYMLDLPGVYQTKNLLTVLEAVHQLKLRGWNISREALHEGLKFAKKSTGLHGRWEIIHQHPAVVLDVGHNIDGVKQITAQLELTDFQHLHIVIGMVKDKEVDQVMKLLPKHARYYFTQAQIPRAMDATVLQTIAGECGLTGSTYPEVNQALKAAMAAAGKEDLILVCGSVFLIGEINL